MALLHHRGLINIGYCLVLLAFVSGCSTRSAQKSEPFTASRVHPYTEYLFQAPTTDVSAYKSVHLRPNNQTDLAVAVAISGGGQRAANFGAGVLIGLESIDEFASNDNALEEVDYFSTVSGGGMTVAAYLSARHSWLTRAGNRSERFSFAEALKRVGNKKRKQLKKDCKTANVEAFYAEQRSLHVTDPCLRRHLDRGYHNNILRALTKPDIWFTPLDRGDMLEDAFAKELLGGNWNERDLKLGELFVAKNTNVQPKYPQWIANATVLENGAIFPFTPDIVARYKVNGYTHRLKEQRKPATQSHIDFANQIPVSLPLAASGNFPSLIAPQTLMSDHDKDNPYLHLLDGGIADNLGLLSAIGLLNSEPQSVKRKLLIVIDAYPGEFAPYSTQESGPNWMQVYSKLPNMPLDGFRGRSRKLLDLVDQNSNVDVVYLSFDELYCADEDDPFSEDPACVEGLFEAIGDHYDKRKRLTKFREEHPKKSPFDIARSVKTSYNITSSEQDFLIAAGQYIVSRHKEAIVAALVPP